MYVYRYNVYVFCVEDECRICLRWCLWDWVLLIFSLTLFLSLSLSPLFLSHSICTTSNECSNFCESLRDFGNLYKINDVDDVRFLLDFGIQHRHITALWSNTCLCMRFWAKHKTISKASHEPIKWTQFLVGNAFTSFSVM